MPNPPFIKKLISLMMDIEVYRNYFLVMFFNPEKGTVAHFELFDGHPLDIARIKGILRASRIFTFNGINYDLPVLTQALEGYTTEQLKNLSDKIIVNGIHPWSMGIRNIECEHVDLMNVAPGMAGLKKYGARLGTKKLQDLPIEPSALITPEQHALLREYCENDLRLTNELRLALTPELDLRERMSEQYQIDLLSKSDAQIAEVVIGREVEKLTGEPVVKPDGQQDRAIRYEPPAFLSFTSNEMKRVLQIASNADFFTDAGGKPKIPPALQKLKINIGAGVYKMGIGGLHSSEKKAMHESDGDFVLIDRDVTSYYPSIFLNLGLEPPQMRGGFTPVFRKIVEQRLEAKKSGDTTTADSLKITINGTYGKTGSKYSRLYAPKLLIQTTITGQLALLMLIEMLEDEGIPVVSANTDGIVIKCPRSKIDLMNFVVWEWETKTGFNTEDTEYAGLYSRDVNSYLAIKPNGMIKSKGAFAYASLRTDPNSDVIIDAVADFIRYGKPISETIHECRDINKFVMVRKVENGAVDQSGIPLGKHVRWYYALGVSGSITYQVNGYRVPKTEGARPLMELPEGLPDDINFAYYINEAKTRLAEIGIANDAEFVPLSLRQQKKAA